MEKVLDDMTRDERSLMLYLETRAVDYGGKVNVPHMNAEDMEVTKKWNKEGFIKFGRIKFHDILSKQSGTHWCELSDEAWVLVAMERKARYQRIADKLAFGKVGVDA